MSTTTQPTVYLEVNGKPIPAKECCWISTAPCGCVDGVMTAESSGEVYATAEQAAAHYYENKVARKRSEQEGFTLSLVTFEAFRAMPFLDCEHDPKWGVARVELPEGWQWGTNDSAFGRQTHIKHMVPVDSIPAPKTPFSDYPERKIPALCGATPSGGWWREVNMWVDCVSCRKCDAKAAGS